MLERWQIALYALAVVCLSAQQTFYVLKRGVLLILHAVYALYSRTMGLHSTHQAANFSAFRSSKNYLELPLRVLLAKFVKNMRHALLVMTNI